MCRVQAPSRLHFGLISLPEPQESSHFPDRRFGGVGLMIDRPGIDLSLEPAPSWSAEGPLAERALGFAQQFIRSLCLGDEKAFHIHIEHSAPEHAGLGTGTQLGMAVARALAIALGGEFARWPAVKLAQHLGRGKRSAIGIHGFDRGGLIVDGGKGPGTAVAPLIARMSFPEAWRVLVILAKADPGVHGLDEHHAFERLKTEDTRTNALCRLVLLGILPALAEQDLPAFGAAVYEFNRLVGEIFRPFQVGVYASTQGEAVVEFVRRQGIAAVGQSSWGPAIFAVTAEDQADPLAQRLRDHFVFDATDVIITGASSQGARVVV